MNEELESQLEKWKKLLLVYAGASGVILVTALAELPLNFATYQQMGNIMTVSPWFGICFVLILANLAPGIVLFAGRAWRVLPLRRRQGTALGLLACAWCALAALDLRAMPLDLPVWFHLVIFALGAGLAAAALALIRANLLPRELFP